MTKTGAQTSDTSSPEPSRFRQLGTRVRERLTPSHNGRTRRLRYAQISGWGMYVPEEIRTNADIAQMVDTNDEWIVSRTGIRERRIAAEHENTTTQALAAAR